SSPSSRRIPTTSTAPWRTCCGCCPRRRSSERSSAVLPAVGRQPLIAHHSGKDSPLRGQPLSPRHGGGSGGVRGGGMTGWRLVVAVSLVAGSVLVARTVSAADDYRVGDQYTTGDEYAAAESAGTDDTWEQIGWGALTGLSNLVYLPAKLVYASLGGLTGG